jgi:hypothetical protein
LFRAASLLRPSSPAVVRAYTCTSLRFSVPLSLPLPPPLPLPPRLLSTIDGFGSLPMDSINSWRYLNAAKATNMSKMKKTTMITAMRSLPFISWCVVCCKRRFGCEVPILPEQRTKYNGFLPLHFACVARPMGKGGWLLSWQFWACAAAGLQTDISSRFGRPAVRDDRRLRVTVHRARLSCRNHRWWHCALDPEVEQCSLALVKTRVQVAARMYPGASMFRSARKQCLFSQSGPAIR